RRRRKLAVCASRNRVHDAESKNALVQNTAEEHMRVLMAEDDPVSRRLLQTYLEKWGHDVTVATDGMEAWRSFEAGDFWVVISDWTMPELDGVELIRRIR